MFCVLQNRKCHSCKPDNNFDWRNCLWKDNASTSVCFRGWYASGETDCSYSGIYFGIILYGGFTPLGRVWLSDGYDFKQSTTLISIGFRVKNFRKTCTKTGNLMWRSLDSLDTRYRDFCCCSKAIFSSEKRVITIII